MWWKKAYFHMVEGSMETIGTAVVLWMLEVTPETARRDVSPISSRN
jgi:hypothetical protein